MRALSLSAVIATHRDRPRTSPLRGEDERLMRAMQNERLKQELAWEEDWMRLFEEEMRNASL